MIKQNRLKELRKQKGLTQIELANRAGISHQWIASIEQGVSRGTSDRVKKSIADALGVSIEEIFPEVKKMREEILFEIAIQDRDLYRKIKKSPKFTVKDKEWLLNNFGDYILYRKKLHILAKKYLQNSD